MRNSTNNNGIRITTTVVVLIRSSSIIYFVLLLFLFVENKLSEKLVGSFFLARSRVRHKQKAFLSSSTDQAYIIFIRYVLVRQS